MAGDSLAMLDTSTTTLRTRRAYDHRLRDQVVRTGTRCLPKHLAIPRSTVSTWRRRGERSVITIEPIEQDHQQWTRWQRSSSKCESSQLSSGIRADLALENLALRQQLANLRRALGCPCAQERPRLRPHLPPRIGRQC